MQEYYVLHSGGGFPEPEHMRTAVSRQRTGRKPAIFPASRRLKVESGIVLNKE